MTSHEKILVKKKVVNVPTPTPKEVKIYLDKWDSLENYVLQEKSLNKLFISTYPNNKEIEDVLIKVSCLNDFYSTNIFSPFSVAKHIINLNIDERLINSDLELVNQIAKININGKEKRFYSFATKYCSHHYPEAFPIYDSFVDKMLIYFKRDKYCDFENEELKNYATFHKVLECFREFYGLKNFSIKQIDKYLWQAGKMYFPRKY